MIKYLQLQKIFDVQLMQEESLKLDNGYWKLHYNKSNYDGDWSILPLRSLGGSIDNLLAVHSNASDNHFAYKDTELLNECPYIKSVLESFECEKTSVRLMKLHAGAFIKEHSDHELSFEEGEARIHIPVFTNDLVEFYVEDERVMMKEGECWYLNLSLKHKVNNFGVTDRIHLVIDCKVNDWLREQFSLPGLYQKHIDAEKELEFSREEKQMIIDQLKLMNTDTSLSLAAKMEAEL